jgi:hypothetical protein
MGAHPSKTRGGEPDVKRSPAEKQKHEHDEMEKALEQGLESGQRHPAIAEQKGQAPPLAGISAKSMS